MAWQTPKTDWKTTDAVTKDDFNRIEGNTDFLKSKLDEHKDMKGNTHGLGEGEYLAKTSREDQLVDWNEIQNRPQSVTETDVFAKKVIEIWDGSLFGSLHGFGFKDWEYMYKSGIYYHTRESGDAGAFRLQFIGGDWWYDIKYAIILDLHGEVEIPYGGFLISFWFEVPYEYSDDVGYLISGEDFNFGVRLHESHNTYVEFQGYSMNIGAWMVGENFIVAGIKDNRVVGAINDSDWKEEAYADDPVASTDIQYIWIGRKSDGTAGTVVRVKNIVVSVYHQFNHKTVFENRLNLIKG